MQISVTEAKGRLTDLVRRALAGDDVVLTRYGAPSVRLVPVKAIKNAPMRRALMEAVGESGAASATPGPSAARSQDFLYDDDGLPK